MSNGKIARERSFQLLRVKSGHKVDAETRACENVRMAKSEKYHEQIECLRDIYLEDSFVLSLIEGQDSIEFELEAVLTKEHPSYHPPKPNEQHCYKKLTLRLGSCSNVNWIRKSLRPSTDANGEIDYGNIDYFSVTKDQLHLSGDWGEVRLECSDVSLRYD